ncbi:MAG: glycosyltransferase, partial [Planctomycetota bacterium]
MLTARAPKEHTSESQRQGEPCRGKCDLSIIVPIFNEEDNVEPLCTELTDVLEHAGLDYEIILVDDGSTDGTLER